MRSEISRMYSRPAQCSPLRRSFRPGGWTTGRSSATDGLCIVCVGVPDLVGGQVEVFEDRVATGPGLRGELHDLDELVRGEADLVRQYRQAVAVERLGHGRRLLLRPTQVHREGRAQAALLAVARGTLGEEQVEGVVDLVAGARGGA